MSNKLKFLRIEGNVNPEQIFGGEVFVSKITGIRPHMSKNPLSQSISVEATETELMILFYDIWAIVGDDIVKDWVSREGFRLESGFEKVS